MRDLKSPVLVESLDIAELVSFRYDNLQLMQVKTVGFRLTSSSQEEHQCDRSYAFIEVIDGP